jgi:hypothetical protein
MNDVSKTEGRYLKIISSSQIVRIKNFSVITQLYDVESAAGKISTIQSNRVSQQVSPQDVVEFIRLQDRHAV